MKKTTVVNVRKQKAEVYIGRPPRGEGIPDPPARGCFGNPFHVEGIGREEAISRFESYFLHRVETDEEFREAVLAIRGKALGCFCKPQACHGDVIARWLDRHEIGREGGLHAAK